MKKRIWIVGASSGIGLELVKLWLKAGNQVIASARTATKTAELQELQFKYPNHLILLDIDVSSLANIQHVSQEAWNAYDGLDVWFYNAGAYHVMDIHQWDVEKFEQMNDTNYMGVVRLMHTLLPYFIAQGHGKWVWNASLSSYFGLPLGGGYSAPKAAMVNLAESISPELLNSNILLQVINHGFVKTRLTAKNTFKMPQLMEPARTAEKIAHEIEQSNRFEIHFPFALSAFLRLLQWLPYALSLRLTRKMIP